MSDETQQQGQAGTAGQVAQIGVEHLGDVVPVTPSAGPIQQQQPQTPAPKPAEVPTVGRIVHYVLDEADAKIINEEMHTHPHIGGSHYAGQHVPAIVTQVWTPECVNLKVFLDGIDVLWRTSVLRDASPSALLQHFWHWPERS